MYWAQTTAITPDPITGQIAFDPQEKCTQSDARFLPSNVIGAPCRIRTCDLRIRSPVLYPAELRARAARHSDLFHDRKSR